MTALHIREIENEGRILVKSCAAPADIASRIDATLGISLPIETGQSESSVVTALCLAPREWLLLTSIQDHSRLLTGIGNCLSDTVSHVADVSSAKRGFEVSGQDAADLLAGVCPLDLDPAVFGPGQCARSLLVRVPVCVLRCAEPAAFRLYVDRNLSAYARDWLSDAAAMTMAERSS